MRPVELNKLIDECGELHKAVKAAEANYETSRARLRAALEADVGAGQWVTAALYKAGLIADLVNTIDPLAFLERVKNSKFRAKILRVNITDAKALLSPAIYAALVKTAPSDKPKLYVRELKATELVGK